MRSMLCSHAPREYDAPMRASRASPESRLHHQIGLVRRGPLLVDQPRALPSQQLTCHLCV
eukprot:scaffold46837_cov30-Tisochrysis_lutea.AAC.2